MPSPHPACLPVEKLLQQCQETRGRASGPGGQHRNKVETKVILVHTPSGVRGEAGERRSQAQNRSVATRRLRLALAVQVRTQPEVDPSPLWTRRCRGKKIVCSDAHADYPALLAEGLDRLAAVGWVPQDAALALRCSSTQLVRFVASHGPAFALLNREREQLGLHPLR